MSIYFTDTVKHLFCLCDDLRADAVAGNGCDSIFHILSSDFHAILLPIILSYPPAIFNHNHCMKLYMFSICSITSGYLFAHKNVAKRSYVRMFGGILIQQRRTLCYAPIIAYAFFFIPTCSGGFRSRKQIPLPGWIPWRLSVPHGC